MYNLVPIIQSLSSYYSPAGITSLVIIRGNNFNKFSRIKFADKYPIVIFVSSQQLEFYVPASINTYGKYPIQVINNQYYSNIVNYNIDNSSGYWLLDPPTQTITNTNTNGILFHPPIKGIPFFTGYFGVNNNIIDTNNNFIIINSTSYSNIYLENNNNNTYLNFKYSGNYLIQFILATSVNPYTNYSKLTFNLVSYPDTNNIIQSYYNSGIWNETSINIIFFLQVTKSNTTITFTTSSTPHNIFISTLSSNFNRLIVSQIG
jgi:hypothetical protein